jgi:hypothetical protein
MAGPSVVYDDGVFTWTYTAGTTPATELHLKWGTATGVYPNQKVITPAASGTAKVNTVLPAGSLGQFYAKMVLANAKGEGTASAEVPFTVVTGLPDGSLTFTVA